MADDTATKNKRAFSSAFAPQAPAERTPDEAGNYVTPTQPKAKEYSYGKPGVKEAPYTPVPMTEKEEQAAAKPKKSALEQGADIVKARKPQVYSGTE